MGGGECTGSEQGEGGMDQDGQDLVCMRRVCAVYVADGSCVCVYVHM